ncbi:aminoacyl-tRNA deacylase, partial [Candidatus Hakubella thermalkaliphila]
LVVKAKGKRAIVVLPGSSRLDARKLKILMGHSDARLLLEEELEMEFPSFEVGAIPPIGALFGFPVYVDERLQAEKIVFTGGTHVDSVRMNYSDLLSLVHPQVVDLVEEPE